MQSDKQAIRELIETWMRATADGDLPQLLKWMADDVVFLTPGQPPMGKAAFETAFQGLSRHFTIGALSEVQEIEIAGDLAYCWNRLSVTITPKMGGEAKRRAGDTLCVLRKQPDGAWVIFRDANLLTVQPG